MTKSQSREVDLQSSIDQHLQNIKILQEEKEQYVKEKQELQTLYANKCKQCESLEGELAREKCINSIHKEYLNAWTKKSPTVVLSMTGSKEEDKVKKETERKQADHPAISEKEEIFHFIHPSVETKDEWSIHHEVKRLVSRNGIQEICYYLKEMRKENKILLPQSPSSAYNELVRMGMPNKDGFNEITFRKYYNRR